MPSKIKNLLKNLYTTRGKSLTKEILFITAAGPILLTSLFAPNAVQILKPLLRWRKDWDKIERNRIYEALRRLNKKRLIEIVEKGEATYIIIASEGKRLLKKLNYDDLELSQPKHWDGKWRLVIFDVPDKKIRERKCLSQKLKILGFYPLQESVFIYPYDCHDEIDFICEYLSIGRHVNYCTIDSIDKMEGTLRKFFNLRPH